MDEEVPANALTWDDVARLYDAHHSGRRARTLPMDEVFDWVASRRDLVTTTDDRYLIPKNPQR